MIKHAWTWGSNEVLEAEKTTVVSAILMIKSRGRMPAETTAKGTQAPTQLTLGQFDFRSSTARGSECSSAIV